MTTLATDTLPRERATISAEQVAALAALAIVALMAGSTLIWGAVGLAMAALSMVPLAYATLLILTFGK
jgi:hypothetical protein